MIRDKNFKLAQYAYNRWALDLEENETLENVLSERFLAGQAEQIRGYDKKQGLGDIVEIRKRDTGLYAEAIVTDIGSGYVKLEILRKFEPKQPEVSTDIPFVTRWNVGKQKHEVLRAADRYVMATDFPTRERAINWINDHVRATG